MSLSSVDQPRLPVIAVSQLVSLPVDWLWLDRLGRGKLAILDGDPGLGKSLVALDLCARLSTGRSFPDGAAPPAAANSVVLNGEDEPRDTIRPRLQALGADLERVFVLHREELDVGGLLRLPSQVGVLEEILAHTRPALVVIDPITAFLEPSVVTSSDVVVRQSLLPLSQLARKYRCALLLIRHLNKIASHRSMYRGGGSIGFVAACRSAWLIARDPKTPDRCVLAQVKNNLAAPQPSLAYRVTPQPNAPPTLDWLGPVAWTADQLLAETSSAPPLITVRDRAQDFLADFLEASPRTSRQVWAAAQPHGLSERTLRRAKRELEVRSVRVWAGGQRLSYWLLPGQQLPDSIPPDAVPPDLEPWLAPLRERFPPSTPLDEL